MTAHIIINVPKAHLISTPKGDVNHQREQQALISHGALKLVTSLVKSNVRIFSRRSFYTAAPRPDTRRTLAKRETAGSVKIGAF